VFLMRSGIVGAGVCWFSHRNLEIISSGGKFVEGRMHPQASYGHGGWCILKSMANYIFYQDAGYFYGDLA
jgi:hypothetical protein